MTLEQAWNLVESLSDDANQQSKNLWLSNDLGTAIRYQTMCFNKNFLKLDDAQQQIIRYWISNDDEFQDYFKCLSENE
jgi:hypothetical protein